MELKPNAGIRFPVPKMGDAANPNAVFTAH